MAIRPLADLFPKYKPLRQLCILRRWFWILSAMVIVTLLFDKWIGSSNSFYAFFSLSAWSWGYPLVARLSEITALILLCTSNNFSQKKLKKNWKRIQRTSYIYFVSWWVLALRYGDAYGVKISMLLVIWLFLSVFVYKKYKKRR
jgi:DMSO/TMAO reductase YedYZ heme-binding membrane subunit